MKKRRNLKWVKFEYNDEDWDCEEVFKITNDNENSDYDCYLTKREMRALFFFLWDWWGKCQTTRR